MLKLYWICFTVWFGGQLFAQETDIVSLQPDDYLNLKLPPLQELFENARNNPAVEFYNSRLEEENSALKTEKRNWLKYFSLVSTYQYGRIASNTSYSSTESPLIYQYSGQNQHWWSVGASLAVPLDDLIDRKNRVKRQGYKLEQTEMDMEKWYDEQKIRIIDVYTSAIEYLNILKSKVESLTLANAQYTISENDFIHGKISAQSLNDQKIIQSNALTDYERTRAALNSALLKLEILSRTQIINK